MRSFVFAIILIFAALPIFGKQLKVLTIGNSFSQSVLTYLPQVAKSVEGCDLLIEGANIGGCSLMRHWCFISEGESEPSTRDYKNKTKTMKEILLSQKWDIVSIQQRSPDSWRPETYQPYAKNIYNYVKKYAPQAEVVLQQTWSYRADDARISKGGAWGFDQNEMFRRIEAAYAKISKEMNLRVIPVGIAVQKARKLPQYRFTPVKEDDYKKLVYPNLPKNGNEIVGYFKWEKYSKTGEMYLKRDTIHLSPDGAYLQACVWFTFLFKDKKASDIKFTPKEISEKNAKALRAIAQSLR